jgi:hypothetical protein
MDRGLGRQAPAMAIAAIALFAALAGSVYAAAKIDGRTIKVHSLPGNRVIRGSLPANRFRKGAIPGNRLRKGSVLGDRLRPGSVTGVQVDASTLAQVPSAAHAETAASAASAARAGSALNATNAVNAERLDGHVAGCGGGTRPFAGACWQTVGEELPSTAPAAAAACAAHGGELPDALALAAFSQQPGIQLRAGGEWSSDVTNVSGLDAFALVTILPSGKIDSAVSTETRPYRCVIPLLR